MPMNINDIFSRLPIGGDDYSLFNKFKSDVLPMMRQSGVSRIGESVARAPQQYAPPIQHQPMMPQPNTGGPLRPGYTPPGMDVVYKAPQSDQIATRMLGIGNGAVTPLDERELALKSDAIKATAADKDIKNNIAQQKVDISSDRAEVYRYKAENPGIKIIAPKGGHIQAVNSSTGQVVKDFGPTGTMSESDRLDVEKSNDLTKIAAQGTQTRLNQADSSGQRESLAEIQARHALELAKVKNEQNTGTTSTSVVSPDGLTRTTKTSPNAPKIVQMYGPDGSGPYPIPSDKVGDAKSTHKMSETKPSAADIAAYKGK